MKIDTKFIINEYDNRLLVYRGLADYVNTQLSKMIENSKVKIHSLTYRIKTVDSILDKVRRKNLTNPFKEMHDIVGFRVVCLFLSDLKIIRDAINKEFNIFDEDDKIHDSKLNIFGYMSFHIKAKIKPSSTPSHLCIEELPFEIQIRTIAQDAWASISHYLDYKSDNNFPKELERDFHALSGLFYVADTHFTLIRKNQIKHYLEE